MTLNELVKKKIDRLDSVPDELLSVIDRQNEALFKQVLSDLGRLEMKDGKLVASKENLARINAIIENLQRVFFGKEYVEAIKTFAKEIGIQANLNNQILEKTVGSFNDDELFKALVQKSQQNSLMLLDENAVRSELLQPLADAMTNSIASGSTFADVVDILRAKMVGENSTFYKYAKTYVKDAFTISDRVYTNILNEKHGIVFFRYAGGTIEGTRDFCDERAGGYFHIKEIEQWGEGINTDKSKFDFPRYLYTTKSGVRIYWAGMHYETNRSTIKNLLGGYECRHVPAGVVTESVPKEWLDRAIRLGFYKE